MPGTLSAGETPLGRLAGALSAGGGLIGQVAALKAKKAELEERGLMATHQLAMGQLGLQTGDEKLKVLSNSLDMANQRTYEQQVLDDWNSLTEPEQNAYSARQASEQQALREAVAEADHSLVQARNEAITTEVRENGPGTSNSSPAVKQMVDETFLGNRAADALRTEIEVELEKISEGKDAKGNPNVINDDEFAGVVYGIVHRLKEEKEITHGTEADRAFNKSVSAFTAQYLPAIKKGFFDAQDLQQKAAITQYAADAVFAAMAQEDMMGALLPSKDALEVAGAVGGYAGGFLRAAVGVSPEEWDAWVAKHVAQAKKDTPGLALLDPIYSLYWAKVRALSADDFEDQMAIAVASLLKTGEPGIEKARILIGIPDSDSTFKHRGVPYRQSNHYNIMANAIAVEADRLDDKASNTASKRAASLLEKARGPMTQAISQVAPDSRASSLFMFQAAIGTGDTSVFSAFLQDQPDLMAEIEEADPNVKVLLLRNAVSEMFAIGSMTDGVQGAVLQSIMGVGRTFSQDGTLAEIITALKDGDGNLGIDDAGLVSTLGLYKGDELYKLSQKTADDLGTWQHSNATAVHEYVTKPTRDKIQSQAIGFYKKVVDDYTEKYGKAPTLPVLQQLARETLRDIHYKGYLNLWARNFEAWSTKKALQNASKKARMEEVELRRDAGVQKGGPTGPSADPYVLSRAYEKQQASLKEQQAAFPKGSPEAQVRADITAKGRADDAATFLHSWDAASVAANDYYESVRHDTVEVISSLFVPLDRWAVQEFRKYIHPTVDASVLEDPSKLKHSKNQLDIKEKREQAKKLHVDITKAFRQVAEWGMTSEEVLNLLNTGYADGVELDGYTLGTGDTFLSPAAQSILNEDEDAVPFYQYGARDPKGPWGLNPVKGWKMLSGKIREEPTPGWGESAKQHLLARQQSYIEQASSFLPDHVIPSNFFKEVEGGTRNRMVPLTNLPNNGATRDADGKATAVNLSVIETALNITSEQSEILARHYGNVFTNAAGIVTVDATSFYIDQYNTPLMKARYFAPQVK